MLVGAILASHLLGEAAPAVPPSGRAAEGLIGESTAAVELLYSQQLPDPRGLPYRTIEVETGDIWSGGGRIIQTHGWVLPDGRSAICWNGLIYRVVALGAPVKLSDDFADAPSRPASSAVNLEWPITLESTRGRTIAEASSLETNRVSALALVFLLRLNEEEMARGLMRYFAIRQVPNGPPSSAVDHSLYLMAAYQWAWAAYDRAICAHMRGDVATVVADTSRLQAIAPTIEAEAAKRGFKDSGRTEPFLPFLSNLGELSRDAARRSARPPRPAFDLAGITNRPTAVERIALLIDYLDETRARQWGQPGGISIAESPIYLALAAEGEAAIEALLKVVEGDERLTQSVSFHRDFRPQRNLISVKQVATACLRRITGLNQDAAGANPAVWREWWNRNRNVRPEERWFNQLADDTGGWQKWEDAASTILQRSGGYARMGMHGFSGRVGPEMTTQPFVGEVLRTKHDPAVTELLRRRALQLATGRRSSYDCTLGAKFALMLYEWDPRHPDTLATLGELARSCVDFEIAQQKAEDPNDRSHLAGWVANLALARLRQGDSSAWTNYVDYLKLRAPDSLSSEVVRGFSVFWEAPPSELRDRVVQELFDHSTTWSALLANPRAPGNYAAEQLIVTPLLRFGAFRNLVIHRLRDRQVAGTMTQEGELPEPRKFAWLDGSNSGWINPTGVQPPREYTIRLCDRIALRLQLLPGVPAFDPTRSDLERDVQCAAIAGYLERYGPQIDYLKNDFPDESFLPLYTLRQSPVFSRISPIFALLNRVAMPEDVRSNRSIFSVESGQVRPVLERVESWPLEAEWKNKLEVIETHDGQTRRVLKGLPGRVWQAEEVLEGDQWVRYYGFVGPHSMAKVPATEVEITDFRLRLPSPTGQ